MSRFEDLQEAINALPPDMVMVRVSINAMLHRVQEVEMRAYTDGAMDSALAITRDENILGPLRKIRELLA